MRDEQERRRSVWLGLVLVLTSAWNGVACSGGCPTLQACDIRGERCQDHTREVAACLRERDTSSAAVEVVDAEAFVEARVLESTANPEPPSQHDLRRGLALLALMPESDEAGQTVRDYWNWVGAFYSSEQHQITILDWGSALDSPFYAGLLLHEMIHAMQRDDAGLDDEQHYSTYDEALAFRAMIEGEADLYQDLAILEGYGRDADNSDFGAIFRQFQEREWRKARGNSSPYELAWHRFPYAFGGGYVNRAWRAGGSGAVRDVFTNVPESTRQILTGYDAPAPSELPWKEDPNEVGKPILTAEFQHVATLHLGTWLFEIWKDLLGLSGRNSAEFADSGFAGDVLHVFRLPASGDVVVVWRLRFGNADQVAGVSASLRTDPFSTTLIDGTDLIVVGDTRGAPPVSFIEALAWEAATPEDWEETPSSASGSRLGRTVTCRRTRPQ